MCFGEATSDVALPELRFTARLRLGDAVQRMWINQPSTLQPLHNLHGTNVLAVREDIGWRVYFLSGVVISQQVPRGTLSEGWR